jgi:hypothetical protein
MILLFGRRKRLLGEAGSLVCFACGLCYCGGRAVTGGDQPGSDLSNAADASMEKGMEASIGVQDAGVAREAGWTSGESCIQGSGITYVSSGEAGRCIVACDCNSTVSPPILACTEDCTVPAPTGQLPPGCGPGRTCMTGQQCDQGVLIEVSACFVGCVCDSFGNYQCGATCPNDCGFPSTPFCKICQGGKTLCEHFVLLNGNCVSEICPEDGPIMGR